MVRGRSKRKGCGKGRSGVCGDGAQSCGGVDETEEGNSAREKRTVCLPFTNTRSLCAIFTLFSFILIIYNIFTLIFIAVFIKKLI